MIYESSDDSNLLLKHVKDYARGRVLDMGTGSGVIAALAKKTAREVIGVDINPEVIEFCRENYKDIPFIESNLFSKVEGNFDLITFNPPYLPSEQNEDLDTMIVVSGGKKGNELTLKFLEEAKSHLNKEGRILIIISSLSSPDETKNKAKKMGYNLKIIDSLKLFFEELELLELSL